MRDPVSCNRHPHETWSSSHSWSKIAAVRRFPPSSSATLPLSLLTLGTYFLGMLTGGMLIAFIRSLVRGATKPKPNQYAGIA